MYALHDEDKLNYFFIVIPLMFVILLIMLPRPQCLNIYVNIFISVCGNRDWNIHFGMSLCIASIWWYLMKFKFRLKVKVFWRSRVYFLTKFVVICVWAWKLNWSEILHRAGKFSKFLYSWKYSSLDSLDFMPFWIYRVSNKLTLSRVINAVFDPFPKKIENSI